ncbi:MAG: carbohydrate-binding domain-containing protein [Anaerovoracaceae bacterium]
MEKNTFLGAPKRFLAAAITIVMIAVSFTFAVSSCEATTADAATVVLYENDEVLTAMAEKAKGVKEYTDYTQSEYQKVTLNGDSIAFEGTGATVNGSDLIISEAGTYVISGTLNDGAIIVESAAEENVVLVLENANITCSDGAPIYVKECGKNVVIALPEETENVISDGAEYTYEYVEQKTDETTGEVSVQPSGAIFSKADLRINGSGSLTVNANNNDGISGKDDVEIAQATLVINSADDGIVGKDCVAVRSGNITINAKADGIKATNDEDETKGYVAVADGNIAITSGEDGIQAETVLMTIGGEFNIKTGAGYAEALAANKVENPMGGAGGFGERRGNADRTTKSQQQNQTQQGQQQNQTQQGQQQNQTQQPAAGQVLKNANGNGKIQLMAQGGQQSGENMNQGQQPGGMQPLQDMAGGQQQATNGSVPQNQAGNQQGTMPQNGQQTPQNGQQIANGSLQGQTQPADNGMQNQQNNANQWADADTNTDADDTNTTSIKALKAGSKLLIQDGTFNIDSEDDALHSDGYLAIAETTLTASSGDDGIHADEKVDIYAGTITIANSYEGLEGKEIVINGGTLDITASDDGINVGGDAAETDSETSFTLTINNGKVNVNADGDGIDVNGSGYITGGTVIVEGPTNSGNGGLDYDGKFEVTGGTLIVTGCQGMAMTPSDGTTVNTVATAVTTQEAGTEVTLVDSEGNVLLTVTPEKEFSHIVISSSEIETGESYRIMAGSTELASFTADDTITNLSGGTGNFGGGRGGFGGQQNQQGQMVNGGQQNQQKQPMQGGMQNGQPVQQ